jgi:hypothetical protein
MSTAIFPVFDVKRALCVLALILAAGVSATAVKAQIIGLHDGNSTASVNLGSQAGMYSWTINGQNQLNQQWFWYRVDGDPTGQHSIDTLTLSSYLANANSLNATYTLGNSFNVNLAYTLSGGLAGGNDFSSDITENITINNLSSSPLSFHFYQYSDFALAGSVGGESAQIFQSGGFFTKANVVKALNQVAETIDQPLANEAEADITPNTLNRLNSGAPYTLNNTVFQGPDATHDATWTLEWDFTIGGLGSVDVLKDKRLSVASVPEPGMVVFLSVGLGVLALRRSRRPA